MLLPSPHAVALSAPLSASIAPSLDSLSVTGPINSTNPRERQAVSLAASRRVVTGSPAGLQAAVLLLTSAPDLSSRRRLLLLPAPLAQVTFFPAGGLLSGPPGSTLQGRHPSRVPWLRCLPLLRVIQLQAAAASPLKRPPSEHLLVPLAPRPAVGLACGQALLGPRVCSFIRPQPLPSSLAWVAARNTEILCIPSC